jgi:predicted permease
MWVIAKSIFWTSLGLFLWRWQFIPAYLPQTIGRTLYWVGVPLQVFLLAHRSEFTETTWFAPIITILVLCFAFGLANLCWHCQSANDRERLEQSSLQGSFILASMLGNTGFIGLAIAPALVSKTYWSWILLYGVTHNLVGSYGLGVVLASYFGNSVKKNQIWRDLLTVPSLWSFVLGYQTRHLEFPLYLDTILQTLGWTVIPLAFILIGMQLSQLQGIQSFHNAILPTMLKMLVVPAILGLVFTLGGLTGEARFTLVLMSGMPTAFANVILAEEYHLNREIAASSILLSTIFLPLIIPLWKILFN